MRSTDIKDSRKIRSRDATEQLQNVFDDYSVPLTDRMHQGLEILGDKLVTDLAEQYEEVVMLNESNMPSMKAYADAEVARLLRMLEKRKGMLESLQASVTLDEAAAARIARYEAMITTHSASESD